MRRSAVGPLLAAALVSGCGKRGDPLPPIRRTPQPIADLRIAQRGDRLEVSFTAPRNATDGARLPVLDAEVLRAEREGDFQKVARPTRRKVAPGERIVEEGPLPPTGTRLRVAVRTRVKSAMSALTPVRELTVTTSPAPPSGLATRSDPKGAALTWTAPEVTTEAEPAPVPSAFFVYRRSKIGDYGSALEAEPTTATGYVDLSAAPGETLCYQVRVVSSTQPLVESAPSDESCLDVKDVAPPAPPAGVAARDTPEGIEVSWSPSAEPDLAAYRVYRWTPETSTQRIAEVPATETTFLDTAAPTGVQLRYAVSAVDKAGNESERAGGVTSRRP